MKKIITIALVLITVTVFAQDNYYFSSFDLAVYKQAVHQGNEYIPMYSNAGLSYESGKVILDKAKKKLIVKWSNGTDWFANINKIDSITEFDPMWGNVPKTMYFGTWSEKNIPCMLALVETKKNGIQMYLFSAKVIDQDYNINCWKKEFWLHSEPLVQIGKENE